MCVCMLGHFSHVQLCATLWTVAHKAPLSMGFSRQEYWSGLPCPPPGDLPDPRTEPVSLASPALAGGFFTTSNTWETPIIYIHVYNDLLLHGKLPQNFAAETANIYYLHFWVSGIWVCLHWVTLAEFLRRLPGCDHLKAPVWGIYCQAGSCDHCRLQVRCGCCPETSIPCYTGFPIDQLTTGHWFTSEWAREKGRRCPRQKSQSFCNLPSEVIASLLPYSVHSEWVQSPACTRGERINYTRMRKPVGSLGAL